MELENKTCRIDPPVWASKAQQRGKSSEEKSPIKFCLYARKSSESDERQALSIDSQIKEMLEYAKREDIEVQEILQESHSAKESRQRPVFNQLINDIKFGKYNGIITWSNDRLSRNAGDLGSLVDMMDDGFLTEIRTYNQKFNNSPNEKFLLMILGSQAKLENDNRGINAQRGLKTKCEMGQRPTMAPLGFINDRANHIVKIDSKRVPIIREMFERVAYQKYTGRSLVSWLDEVGFKTRKGKKVCYSIIYNMLKNPYYCGLFEFPIGSGKWYNTKHKAIIDRDLFDKVQRKLIVHPKTWPGTKTFKFTKLLKCGACGSGITACEKIKRNKTNDKQRRYVYYFCTKFRDLHCPEPFIREESLAEQLEALLNQIPIENFESDEKIRFEIDKFMKMGKYVQKNNALETFKAPENLKRLAVSSFIKNLLENGGKEELRYLLNSLNAPIHLKDKQVYIKT